VLVAGGSVAGGGGGAGVGGLIAAGLVAADLQRLLAAVRAADHLAACVERIFSNQRLALGANPLALKIGAGVARIRESRCGHGPSADRLTPIQPKRAGRWNGRAGEAQALEDFKGFAWVRGGQARGFGLSLGERGMADGGAFGAGAINVIVGFHGQDFGIDGISFGLVRGGRTAAEPNGITRRLAWCSTYNPQPSWRGGFQRRLVARLRFRVLGFCPPQRIPHHPF
jgi:hypothetical protein